MLMFLGRYHGFHSFFSMLMAMTICGNILYNSDLKQLQGKVESFQVELSKDRGDGVG